MHRRKHPLFSFADVSHTQIITRQVFRRLAAMQPVVEAVRVAELATKPLDLVPWRLVHKHMQHVQ